MGSRETRTRNNRRDRRKAKASNWTRAGTTNPKKVGHHSYHSTYYTPVVIKKKQTKQSFEVDGWSKLFGTRENTLEGCNEFESLASIRNGLPRDTYFRRCIRFCKDLLIKLRKKL